MSKLQSFIKEIRETCENHSFKFSIENTNSIYSDGVPCWGYVDTGDDRVLRVARGTNLVKEWVSILAHEYCHLKQYIERHPTLVLVDRGEGSNARFDKYLMRTKMDRPYTPFKKRRDVQKIVANELDCEKKTSRLIKRYKLPIDPVNYIQGANAYLMSYYFSEKMRVWLSGRNSAWKNQIIMDHMPTYYLKTEADYRRAYKNLHLIFLSQFSHIKKIKKV